MFYHHIQSWSKANVYDVVLCLSVVLHVPVKAASCFGY